MGRGRHGSGVDAKGGALRIRFTYQGKRCAEMVPLTPTPANIKAVERLSAEVRQKIALGIFDYATTFPNSKNVTPPEVEPADTVAQYAAVWLQTLTGEKSTLLGYKAQINKFWLTVLVGDKDSQRPLGELALTAVRHTHIATAIANKAAEGASGKTTNNLLIPIRALFAGAVADEKIDSSPVDKVHNRKHQRKPIDPFDRVEMDMILDRMARYPATVHNYYTVAFAAGMRPSELIALRWGDIDWNRNTAMVSRAQVRHTEKGTKTHQVREVDLNDMAVGALRAQKAITFMRGTDAVIFCSPEGERWLSERRLREQFFQPCLRACGIRQRPAYNTRHTYATLALMAGVNPAYIATQLGHANTAMLFKHYVKWIANADSGREAGKLNAVFGPKLVPKIYGAN